jgi:L1 cell adhesion molecule like protein
LKDLKIHDITPFALKFENVDVAISETIEQSTPIPCQKTVSFQLPTGDEAVSSTTTTVKVFEEYKNHIGDFHIINLPHLEHCALPTIELTFSVDADGIVAVSAADRSGETTRKLVVKPEKHGFLPEEIEAMRQDAEFYQTEDKLRQEQIEARNHLEAFVFSLKQAAEYAPPERVNPLERQQVLETCKQILEWLDGNEYPETDEFVFTLRHAQKQLEPIMLKLQGGIPLDFSYQTARRCRPTPALPRNSMQNGHSHHNGSLSEEQF